MHGLRSNPEVRGAAQAVMPSRPVAAVALGGGAPAWRGGLAAAWAPGAGPPGGLRRARRLVRKLRRGGTVRVLPVDLTLGATRCGAAVVAGWTPAAVPVTAVAPVAMAEPETAEARGSGEARYTRVPRRRRAGSGASRTSGRASRASGLGGAGGPDGLAPSRPTVSQNCESTSASAIRAHDPARPTLSRCDRPPWREHLRFWRPDRGASRIVVIDP